MTLAEIRAARRAKGHPVDVVLNDNVAAKGGRPLHRLIWADGSWEWVNADGVWRCSWNAPDGCDELVNPYGDPLCQRHEAAHVALSAHGDESERGAS